MAVGVMVGDCRRDWAKLRHTSRSPVKVVAGEDLCRGATATFYLKEEVTRVLLTQNGFKIPSEGAPLNEIKMKGNILVAAYQSSSSSASSWLSDLTLAEDVHSENGRLELSSDALIGSEPILVLTLTRKVKKMEHLSFWFSSELAAKLGFPFLNFSHIKDGHYYCSKCSGTFEAPNPLKLHIATSCETLNPEDIWGRLWNNATPSSSPWTFPKFTHRNGTSQIGIMKLNHQTVSIMDEKLKPLSPDSTSSVYPKMGLKFKTRSSNIHQLNPLTSGKSAFKPVTSALQNVATNLSCHEISSSSIQSSSLNLFGHHNIQGTYTVHPLNTFPLNSLSRNPLMPSCSLNHLKWPPLPTLSAPSGPHSPHVKPLISSPHPLFDSLPSTSASDPYAEVETLVSSLGRGKGTHLCLYCGKVYSRKYGLKIHIRTHTGYKPLKCRVCFRPFGDPSNLNKHVRLHAQGDTPYRCDLCGKVLVRKRDLDRHLRSRHSMESIDSLQSSTTDVTDPDDDDCDDVDIDVDVEGINDQQSLFEEATTEVNVQ